MGKTPKTKESPVTPSTLKGGVTSVGKDNVLRLHNKLNAMEKSRQLDKINLKQMELQLLAINEKLSHVMETKSMEKLLKDVPVLTSALAKNKYSCHEWMEQFETFLARHTSLDWKTAVRKALSTQSVVNVVTIDLAQTWSKWSMSKIALPGYYL